MTPEQIEAAMPHIEAAVSNDFLVFPMTTGKKPRDTGWQSKVWDLGTLRHPSIMGYGVTLPKDDPRRVIDLDIDDGGKGIQPGKLPWQERLAALEAEHGAMPATKTTLTPSGGIHRWFLWPDGVPLPGAGWHGFTVRQLHGAKNYVIGPGSVRSDGGTYVNEAPGTAIATMPEKLARSDKGVAAGSEPDGDFITITGPYAMPDAIAEGACVEQILKYTMSLWNRRLSLAEMWTLTREVLGPRLVEPHDDEHLREHFDSAVKPLIRNHPRDESGYVIDRADPVEAPDPATFAVPEDRGGATLSDLGQTEYIEDLGRPGRIIVVPAEEGTGKTVGIVGELGIRMALAGGSFAETWPIVTKGPVLVLSEQHPDDDYYNESRVLEALGHERSELAGRYYRLPLMTAAGGAPALMVPEWREYITGWMRDHKVLMLVVDTATGATQVKPWGEEIQAVYRALRLMIAEYPALMVVLLLHMKKPSGRGERGMSDVLGEWGRWCDVVLLMENDGSSLERVKLTTRKRVRRQRKVMVTKRDFLLVDPVDLDEATGPKVPAAAVLKAITAEPGMTFVELGKVLGVSKDTAARYVRSLGEQVLIQQGENRTKRVYPGAERAVLSAAVPQGAAQASAVPVAVPGAVAVPHAARTYIGAAGGAAVPEDGAAGDLTAVARSIFDIVEEVPV